MLISLLNYVIIIIHYFIIRNLEHMFNYKTYYIYIYIYIDMDLFDFYLYNNNLYRV